MREKWDFAMSYAADAKTVLDDPSPSIEQTVQREREILLANSNLQFVHWLVLILSAAVTLLAWQYAKVQETGKVEDRFALAAEQTVDLLEDRLRTYELVLWAGVSAIRVQGEDLTASQWHRFAERLDIEHRYPGINGIGVIYEVTPEGLPEFMAKNRLERPDFRIHPAHGQDIYQPITFIEPVDVNAQAVGLDMAHEANRHTSLNRARDSGDAQITGPIVLVQDSQRTPGFLFFAPFYAGETPGSVDARRANFSGAVYAPFIVDKLVHGVLDQERRSTVIRLKDGQDVLYDEIGAEPLGYGQKQLGTKQFTLAAYGRSWTLEVQAGPDFWDENTGIGAWVVLVLGIGVDSILFGLFVMLSKANGRGLRFADLATEALQTEAKTLRQVNGELQVARAEAESASAMKSSFLSTMSHEVRTPLTAISGMLTLLDQPGSEEHRKELINAGRTASDRLLKLLTDVLDSSRLESNSVVLWERTVLIEPLVEEWRVLVKSLAEKAGKPIDVLVERGDQMPAAMVVDDVRLSQVIGNLIDNAVRFTKEGSITIGVRTGPSEVAFSVRDTGVGIPEGEQEHVFERFRQVDGSLTRENEGSGLGLAICKDLLKLMGGQIRLTSALEVGTTFTVTLPVDGTGAGSDAHDAPKGPSSVS